MTKMNEQMLDFTTPMASAPRTYSQPLSNHYTIYLTGELQDAGEYTEEFVIFKNASEGDVIDIEINGFGGDLFAAVQFYNAIQECRATVRTILQGMAYSAHSMILLAGHEIVVMPNTSMLVHNGVTGHSGPIEEIIKAARHTSDFAKKFINTVYEGFLSKEEIEKVVEYDQKWILDDEIAERLQKRYEYLSEKYNQQEDEYKMASDELVKYVERINNNGVDPHED